MKALAAVGRYLYAWLHLLDQAFNTLLAGDPRETMSARMGRDIAAGRCWLCRPICAALALIQRDHCARAAAGELAPFKPDLQTVDE